VRPNQPARPNHKAWPDTPQTPGYSDHQVAEGVDPAEPVAEVALDAQGLFQHPGRGRVITGQPPNVPEVVEGAGLAKPVRELPRGRGGMPGDGLGPVAVAPQQPGQGAGQRDDPGVLAGAGGVIQAGEQADALGGPALAGVTLAQWTFRSIPLEGLPGLTASGKIAP
jgi:hypothetical protein